MKKNDIGFVFIHGAGLGSYIWDYIKPMLHTDSLMINLPNRNGGDKVNQNLHFSDYSEFILEEVKKWDKQNIIIVAHSIGGLLGIKLAEQIKGKLIGFVCISAAIPVNGNSFISCLPFPKNILIGLIMRLVGTKPPDSTIIQGLCNDLNKEQTKKVIENFTPESVYLYTEKCNAKIPETKKLYFKLLKDAEFSLSVQDKMIKNLNTNNVITIDSGHLPMLSKANELSEKLNEFIVECQN